MSDEGFIGEVKLFAGDFEPRSWKFCHGQLLSISDNSALFAILGTIYGGDGRVNFALPDLRGRAPIGAGKDPVLTQQIKAGIKYGCETATLSSINLPSAEVALTDISFKDGDAVAQIPYSDQYGDTASPEGGCMAVAENGLSPLLQYSKKATGHNQATVRIGQGRAEGTARLKGAASPIDIGNPTLGMNYIICVEGIFPSRS